MSASSRQPLTAAVASHWAASAQLYFLEALTAEKLIQDGEIAFHGGTSLHFSWRSPRLSEDLDFLLARSTVGLDGVVERARQKVADAFRPEDPAITVELHRKNRTQEKLLAYELRVAHPDYLGKVRVKVEFWKVSPEYLAQYPVELRSPVRPRTIVSQVSHLVPAATLQAAYCDKLTAFATRPYLKWRDIYDLWWIGTQTDASLVLPSVAAQFLHNASAYQTIDGLAPAQALRKLLQLDPADILAKADPDLRRWLPPSLWDQLHPRVTAEMIQYVRHALELVADALEKNLTEGNLKRPK